MTELNAAQMKKWEGAKTRALAVNKIVKSNGLLAQNVQSAMELAAQHGIVLSHTENYLSSVQIGQQNDAKLQNMIAAVEAGELGVNFANNDINIMAPTGTTDDQLIQYQMTEFEGVGLIVIGVVVAFGLISITISSYDFGLRRNEQANRILEDADTKFCADPNSPGCVAWLNRKESQDYQQRKSLVEDLQDSAKDLVQSVTTGTKWGLALLLPVGLAFYLLTTSRR